MPAHTAIRRSVISVGAGAALVAALLLSASPVRAAVITVNVTDDNVGDTCPATCSIRAALTVANATTGDVITVPAGTYTLAQGQLVASAPMTITGAGASTTIVDGAALSRVLQITAPGNVGMSGITIQNGKVVGVSSTAAGAGIEVLGTLRLANSIVRNNTVAVTGGGISSPSGGGIAGDSRTSSLTLTNVDVTGNAGSSTSIAFIGGGVGSDGTLTYTGGTVANNVASFQPGDGLGEGGGISISLGTATLSRLDIHDNTSGGGGGVVDENGPSSLSNSTLRSNHSKSTNDEGGGWLANGNSDTLTNVTIVGNDSAAGGGGMTDFTGGSTLVNDTIAGNTAAQAGGGLQSGTLRGTTKVTGTILSGNAPGNCGVIQNGTITSQGSNIDSGTTCGFAAAHDKSSTDPKLGPLQNNGGPAPTRAIASSSPAFDADFATCPPPATDEVGTSRPQGVRCDIGAFEAAAVTTTGPPTPAVGWGGVGAPAAILVVLGAALLGGGTRRRRRPVRR
jgi:hypothetical protein